ncbi:MAG TPA: undecaprenyl-diphosphatase UppP [Candidatus Paceibacterota bacterium]|nr:undecaprenyl-diphosphatase UppP [Candidatus Paceibacterota bacterium]
MTVLQSIILGIVEGATEFLPVSSTGHLILVASLLGVLQTDFAKTFEIAIQLGAILAVVVLYWKRFFDWNLLFKLAAAFVPTGLIGLALYRVEKAYLLGNDWIVLASLFVGGIVLIAFEYLYGKRESDAPELPPESLTYAQAIAVGFAQAVSIIPGVSRSGATIVGGMLLGISRPTIVAFSFLLAVPTMLAATGLSLVKSSFTFTSSEWLVLGVGFAVSFAVALPVVRWLLNYVRSHSFVAFGIYRIALSVLFAAWLLL